MKTILVFYGNQPVLDISTLDVEQGTPNYGTKYGLNRDRNPDSGWDELGSRRLDNAKEVELTPELRKILLEDLAYAYGQNSNKFSQKLIEFGLI